MGAGRLSLLNPGSVYVFCRDLKLAVRPPQLTHFRVDGKPAKNPAAQQLARDGLKKRRADG